MKARRPFLIALLFTVCFAAGFAGCAQVEKAARQVEFITGGTPTTQPTAGEAVARGVVDVVKATNPAAGGALELVKLLAGAVAAGASYYGGRRVASKQAHAVIGEVLEDVKAFKDPHTPFTAKATKLLTTLGYGDAAAVEPKPTAPAVFSTVTGGTGWGTLDVSPFAAPLPLKSASFNPHTYSGDLEADQT